MQNIQYITAIAYKSTETNTTCFHRAQLGKTLSISVVKENSATLFCYEAPEIICGVRNFIVCIAPFTPLCHICPEYFTNAAIARLYLFDAIINWKQLIALTKQLRTADVLFVLLCCISFRRGETLPHVFFCAGATFSETRSSFWALTVPPVCYHHVDLFWFFWVIIVFRC